MAKTFTGVHMNLAATCSKHMELHAHRVLEKHLPYFNLVFLVQCMGMEGMEVRSVACVLPIVPSLVAFCLESRVLSEAKPGICQGPILLVLPVILPIDFSYH